MTIKTLLQKSLTAVLLLGFAVSAPLWAETEKVDIQGKIIGGTVAPANRFPTTVALLLGESFDAIISGNTTAPATEAYFQSQFCAGTLLSSEWVLTAAHCVVEFSESEVLVLAGTQSLAITDVNNLPGEVSAVSNIIIHPNYNIAEFDTDLALLRLTTPVSSGIPVSTIFQGSLAETPIASSATACTNADNCATIVGWGTTDPVNGETFPVDLIQAEVPLVSNVRCNDFFGGGITNNMLCAGFDAGGVDTCQGDSGGPLFLSTSGNPQANDFQVAGITSFGAGCADPNSPGGYTRVPIFTNYINGFVSGATAIMDIPSIVSQNTTINLSIASGTPVDVATFTANDGDNDILTWSVVDTFGSDPDFVGDASFFAIDSNGLLQLTSVPNPINNPYDMIVQVDDGQDGADFQLVQVTLINDAVSASQSSVTTTTDADNAVLVTVTLNDSAGNPITNAGNVVQISASGSPSPSVGPITNNGDGTYTATITTTAALASTITITAAGVQLSTSPTLNLEPAPSVPPIGDSGTSSGGGSTGWLLLTLLGLTVRGRSKALAA